MIYYHDLWKLEINLICNSITKSLAKDMFSLGRGCSPNCTFVGNSSLIICSNLLSVLLLTWWVGKQSMPDAHSFHSSKCSCSSKLCAPAPYFIKIACGFHLPLTGLTSGLPYSLSGMLRPVAPSDNSKELMRNQSLICLSLVSPCPVCAVSRSTWFGSKDWVKSYCTNLT